MDGFRKLPFPSHVAYNSTRAGGYTKIHFSLQKGSSSHIKSPAQQSRLCVVNACVFSHVSEL
jgi:hypothetical protein